MKKLHKVFSVLLAAVILLCPLTVFATEYVFDESREQYITAEMSDELDKLAKENREKYGFGIYYYYSNQINGDLVSFCEDYWQRYCKNDKNGVLLALTDTEYYVYLAGDANNALNAAEIWSVFSTPQYNYYSAVKAYISFVGEEISAYYGENSVSSATAEPTSGEAAADGENDKSSILIFIVGSLLFGILAAFVFIKTVQNKHRSVNKKATANDYVVPGSLNMTQSYEAFLYRNVTKTEKQQNNNNNNQQTRK